MANDNAIGGDLNNKALESCVLEVRTLNNFVNQGVAIDSVDKSRKIKGLNRCDMLNHLQLLR